MKAFVTETGPESAKVVCGGDADEMENVGAAKKTGSRRFRRSWSRSPKDHAIQ